MKKTTKEELTVCIRKCLDEFWDGLREAVDPDCSFKELPKAR